MAASAGTVTLNLDASSVKMIRELQKAQKSTKRTATRMRKDMGMAFKTIAKGAALMGAAMVAATKLSVDMADAIAKNARTVGLTAEEYQTFAFAAKRAGVEQSQFTSNMTAFVKRVGEAQTGMGPLVTGLKNLDAVLLKNIISAGTQAERLKIVADAMQATESPTIRAAIANAAFSRAGIAMINMLDKGGAGLDAMAKEARDLGIVLSDELIAKSEIAADKMGDLQKVLQVRVAEVVLENADAIIALTTAMINFIAAAPGFIMFVKAEIDALFGAIDNADFVRLSDKMEGLQEDLAKMTDPSLTGKIGRLFAFGGAEEIAAIREEIRTTQNLLDEIEAQVRDRAAKPTGAGQDTPFTPPPIIDPPDTQEKADQVATIIANLMNEVKTFGMTDSDKALINLIDEGATEDQILLFKQVTNEMRLLKEAEEIANAELEEIVVTAERMKDVVQESTSEMEQFGIQAARNLQTAFADFLFNPFEDGLKGMLTGFATMIQRMVAEAAAAAILKSLFGGAAGSSNSFLAGFASVFGRASGGPVMAGNAYLVGEQGPELMVPTSSGNIIPNNQLAGATSITNIINLPPQTRRFTAQQTASEVSRIQKRADGRNR